MSSRRATATHRETFTRYLREAYRQQDVDGRTKMQDWQDWLSQEEIVQCEICCRYGQRGSEVHVHGPDKHLIDACATGACVARAEAEARGWTLDEFELNDGRNTPALRLTDENGYHLDFSANSFYDRFERAAIYLRGRS